MIFLSSLYNSTGQYEGSNMSVGTQRNVNRTNMSFSISKGSREVVKKQ